MFCSSAASLFILDIDTSLGAIGKSFQNLVCYLFAIACFLIILSALIYLFRGNNKVLGKALAACCLVSSVPGLFMGDETYNKCYPVGFLPFLSFFAGLCILYKLGAKKKSAD